MKPSSLVNRNPGPLFFPWNENAFPILPHPDAPDSPMARPVPFTESQRPSVFVTLRSSAAGWEDPGIEREWLRRLDREGGELRRGGWLEAPLQGGILLLAIPT